MSQLLEKIEKLTLSGALDWETTEHEYTYQTSFPNFSLRIFPDENDYVISILNYQGIILESATDRDLSSFLSDAFIKMKLIYESARGSALGTDKAIDEILTELDKKDDIPF